MSNATEKAKQIRDRKANNKKKGARKSPAKVFVVPKQQATPRKPKNQRKKKQVGVQPTTAISGNGAYHLNGSAAWNFPMFKGSIGGGISDGMITGTGAYNVKSNSLMGAIDMTGTVPRVSNVQKGEGFVMNHREFIKDIKSGTFLPDGSDGSTGFNLESFTLNPANPQLFPWLATIAGNFQEYKVTGMLVEFKTTCSDLSTTLSLGTVMMTADYNALAEPPNDKIALENMENAGSCKPSCSLIMPIECAPALTSVSTHLFVGPLDAGVGDARLYDMCNIFLATFGIPKESTTIGELWVTYEIVFYKPKLLVFPTNQDTLSWYGVAFNVTTVAVIPQTDFVTMNHSSPHIYAGWPTTADHGAIYLPDVTGQNFLVSLTWLDVSGSGPDLTITPPGISGNRILAQYLETGGTILVSPDVPPPGRASKNMTATFILRVTDDNKFHPYFTLDPLTGNYLLSELHILVSLWNKDYDTDAPVFVLESKPVFPKELHYLSSKDHVDIEYDVEDGPKSVQDIKPHYRPLVEPKSRTRPLPNLSTISTVHGRITS